MTECTGLSACVAGDLYGALGSPVRVCRTVVVGRRRELVQRVLYVLSYFIRCSDLQESDSRTFDIITPCPPTPQDQTDNPAAPPEMTEAISCSVQTCHLTQCPSQATPGPQQPSDLSSPPSEAVPGPVQTREMPVSLPEIPDAAPSPEKTNDSLLSLSTRDSESALECLSTGTDSVGIETEYEAPNQSPLLHRAHFLIGEQEEDVPLTGPTAASAGLGLERSLRGLMDMRQNESLDSALGDSDAEETPTRQPSVATEKCYELPLPRYHQYKSRGFTYCIVPIAH